MRGVVPEPQSLIMHSETFLLGNHPSRHRKERDDAALLTQEGSFGSDISRSAIPLFLGAGENSAAEASNSRPLPLPTVIISTRLLQ